MESFEDLNEALRFIREDLGGNNVFDHYYIVGYDENGNKVPVRYQENFMPEGTIGPNIW